MNPILLAIAALALLPGAWFSQIMSSLAPPTDLPPISADKNQIASTPTPVKKEITTELKLGAKGVYALDRVSGQVLYGKEATIQRPVASITKVATAVTIIQRHNLDEVITIPSLPNYKSEDELIGIQAGEKYTVRQLLSALLINSANDAADALAISDSGSIQAFSEQMNRMIGEWNISGAHFSNPSGLSDENNQASPQAVAQLSLLALHNESIKSIISKPYGLLTSQGGRTTALKSTNQLLQNGQFSGIKTGYTLAAGECFVGLTKIQGHEVITVVLGSPDRFGETQSLVNWIDKNYTWQ